MPLFSKSILKLRPSQPAAPDYEQRIELLEKQLRALLEQRGDSPLHPVHIEHLHIEKAVIEHVEYNSNIGDLQVNELTGKLNIGANYFGPIPEALVERLVPASSKPKLKMNGKPLDSEGGG